MLRHRNNKPIYYFDKDLNNTQPGVSDGLLVWIALALLAALVVLGVCI